MTVDRKTAERRELTFNTLDEAVAEVEQLAAGPVRVTGNQSFPQLVEHLAKSVHANVAGLEAKFGLPMRAAAWCMRTFLGGLLRKKATTSRMSPGINLPKVLEPEFAGSPEASVEAAVDHYRNALRRLREADDIPTHPVLGKMTPRECEQLHCRHAELHLGFVHPAGE